MKVYVDELPNSCDECPCFNEEYNCCNIDGGDCLLKNDDCFLQSLADYTKQVRKEVCEEIKKKADIEYYEEYDGFDRKIGKTYIIRDYDLDQIQGETKC